ncbi:N-acetyl sugar amidotransferase [Synechococcus sp. HK01-R]|uniref:N-acetyl sugar amidotransferase n=1 Tax=Synechococcus sp. HK01-R TaxID=2751171 RepID=UPI0016248721|nr:N-acetyl sugar amidotransferase [Synechococcus sp. HK01-R]QNG27763.1 N-acetyl sugar amidotransferase [Synechococcus sp. HK01-R]
MNHIYYCKRCLYPSSKPDLWFKDGVCGACHSFDKRSHYDWKNGPQVLREIIHQNKVNPSYDCIVPVSGGKDSTYQAWKLLREGYNPLCVTAPTDQLTPLGRKNIENLKTLGCDYIEISVNQQVRNKINRHAFFNVGDIQWPEHVLIYTIPVHAAVLFKIPIIVWGECPQREYGAGKPEDATLKYFDRRVLEEYGSLNGLRVSDLLNIDGINARDLYFYEYPAADKVEELGIKGLYLDNYFPWNGISNVTIAQSIGFQTYHEPILGTIANYENLDNYVHGIHDYLKYLKFGFGRATDVACNLIRRNLLMRDDAIDLVAKNDGLFPSHYMHKSLEEILNAYNISMQQFSDICDEFTNYDLFQTTPSGELILRPDGSPRLLADFSCVSN